MLNQEIRLGCQQYLIFASGYDTSGYKYINKFITVFEIDKEEMIKDKVNRVKKANIPNQNINYIAADFTNNNWIKNILSSNYKSNQKSFCSLMGISYYLSQTDFSNMIHEIANIITDGSSVIFDYPTIDTSDEAIKTKLLAQEANEEMQSTYSYQDIEKILSENNLYIYEHLNSTDITNQYFYDYNTLNPNHKIIAPKGVAYCYAAKKNM